GAPPDGGAVSLLDGRRAAARQGDAGLLGPALVAARLLFEVARLVVVGVRLFVAVPITQRIGAFAQAVRAVVEALGAVLQILGLGALAQGRAVVSPRGRLRELRSGTFLRRRGAGSKDREEDAGQQAPARGAAPGHRVPNGWSSIAPFNRPEILAPAVTIAALLSVLLLSGVAVAAQRRDRHGRGQDLGTVEW